MQTKLNGEIQKKDMREYMLEIASELTHNGASSEELSKTLNTIARALERVSHLDDNSTNTTTTNNNNNNKL